MLCESPPSACEGFAILHLILLFICHLRPLTSQHVLAKGGKVGDPFSPTLLVISGHIPTQCDACTIVIAHKEK